jgi:DNA repair exonuclease SbcCD ATPase subunit
MIEFQTIRYKNFLSSGNQFTEIKLNETKNTCIIGKNGAGKSTLLDALCFSLFNKPFRKINKGQIVNSQNDKDCVVEIEFAVNSTQYKVIRNRLHRL